MFAIKLDYLLWLEGLQANGSQTVGTHRQEHAQKFASRGEAQLFIDANNLSAGARVVKFNDRGDL